MNTSFAKPVAAPVAPPRSLVRTVRNWAMRVLYHLGIIKPSPLPVAPQGAISRVLFVNIFEPKWGVLCYRFADGSLRQFNRDEIWAPTSAWQLFKETPLAPADGQAASGGNKE